MKNSDIVIKTFVLSDFQENCYVVSVKDQNVSVVIDPGDNPHSVLEYLSNNSLYLSAILITHGHWDHIAGIPTILKEYPDARLFIGINEKSKLSDPIGNLSFFFGTPFVVNIVANSVQNGEIVDCMGLNFHVLEVPGHSKGHVVYLLQGPTFSYIFCGDVIFSGSIGRTDFPDGNPQDLISNIKDKLFTLPDETILCPGHGSLTSIGQEKLHNVYVR